MITNVLPKLALQLPRMAVGKTSLIRSTAVLCLAVLLILPHGGAQQDFYVDGPTTSLEIDIMQAIDPLQGTPLGTITDITNINGNDSISYLKGIDGYPAFLIKRNANIQKSAASFFTTALPDDFAILITVIPSDDQGGFLFSVVNPANTIIQLGVSLTPRVGDDMTDLKLYYTDYRSADTSQVLALFEVPSFVRQWTSIGIKVKADAVTLYMDCLEYNRKEVPGRARGLRFDSGSSLYLGRGSALNEQRFAGGLQQLKVVSDVDKAESQCDDIDPYADSSGSPDFGIVPGSRYPMLKGEKGVRGDRGERGETGRPGDTVTPLPAKQGHKGSKGDTGDAGKDGVQGVPGPPGPSPDQPTGGIGPGGVPGSPGLPGLPGDKGVQGESIVGPPGLPGSPGQAGHQSPDNGMGSGGWNPVAGAVGPKGDRGANGIPGRNGRDGRDGAVGTSGLPGPPGPPAFWGKDEELLGSVGSGDDDDMFPFPGVPSSGGSIGYPGNPGYPGAKGNTGKMGSPGQMGADGRDGVSGLPGMAGKPGESGPRGQKGDMGNPGLGTPGLPGQPGGIGIRGPPGRTLTVKGIDITGPPGESGTKGDKGDSSEGGSCDCTEGGDRGDMGPRGRPGDPGIRGQPGIMGEIGLPGFPGKPGGRGLPGPAVKGQKGESGGGFVGGPGGSYTPGPPGPPGAPGYGVPGRDGQPGPPGAPGLPGHGGPGGHPLPGPPGPAGPPGLPGTGGGGGTQPISGGDEQLTSGAGAVTFRSESDLFMVSHTIPYGTVIFLLDTEVMYVRVTAGFKEILLGKVLLIPATTPSPTKPPPELIPPPEDTTEIIGPMLHLIAANEPYVGDMNGISGADYICYKQARAVGLTGTYRAFLSSRVQDLISIVHRKHDRKYPVVNLHNQKLFNSWNDLFNGAGAYFNDQVPIYSFDGKDVVYDPKWPQKIIWHGTTLQGRRNEKAYCNAWSSDTSRHTGVGSSLIKSMILDNQEFSCNNAFILLCVENSFKLYRK